MIIEQNSNTLLDIVDLLKSTFPFYQERCEVKYAELIEQFKECSKQTAYYCCNVVKDDLIQGDIISEVPFYRYDKDGYEGKARNKAIILSNSCDIENGKDLVLAPLIPLDAIKEISGKKIEIERNLINRFFYIKDAFVKDYVVDFSLLNTFPVLAIKKLCSEQKVKRLGSLTLLGYYLFLCKMTICFMRPEDENVNQDRKKCLTICSNHSAAETQGA